MVFGTYLPTETLSGEAHLNNNEDRVRSDILPSAAAT